MSFEEIDKNNKQITDERSCVIFCNLSKKEEKSIKNVAGIFGINDQISLTYKNGDSIVKCVIENQILEECENGIKERGIIFNNVSQSKMNLFLDNLKKLRIQKPLIAMVTETSKEWSINTLLTNLIEERKAIRSGNNKLH